MTLLAFSFQIQLFLYQQWNLFSPVLKFTDHCRRVGVRIFIVWKFLNCFVLSSYIFSAETMNIFVNAWYSWKLKYANASRLNKQETTKLASNVIKQVKITNKVASWTACFAEIKSVGFTNYQFIFLSTFILFKADCFLSCCAV